MLFFSRIFEILWCKFERNWKLHIYLSSSAFNQPPPAWTWLFEVSDITSCYATTKVVIICRIDFLLIDFTFYKTVNLTVVYHSTSLYNLSLFTSFKSAMKLSGNFGQKSCLYFIISKISAFLVGSIFRIPLMFSKTCEFCFLNFFPWSTKNPQYIFLWGSFYWLKFSLVRSLVNQFFIEKSLCIQQKWEVSIRWDL